MLGGPRSPSWNVEGRGWPNRDRSRFVRSGGISWHVQEMGDGPDLLLLHGTGAATHSFRDLAPELARRGFRVMTLDLPGHGFTERPPASGLSLSGMTRLLGGVLEAAGFRPEFAAGHSAGAAILVSMALQSLIRPKAIAALNGALLPIRGAAVFSPLAKLLFLNPLAPRLFALRAASPVSTRRLLESTGSTIDERGIELYARLFRASGHVAATLGMMAQWDLDRIERGIARLPIPLFLVTAANDKAIPPRDAETIAARLRSARIVALNDGGHLVHEERPIAIAELLTGLAEEVGLQVASRGILNGNIA